VLRKIRVGCPACRTQLSVQCADDDLVKVQCPTCGKRFAARVPQTGAESFDDPLANFNEQIWTAPPKQRRPVRKDPNDDFVQKIVIAIVVMVCSGAVLVPLAIIAYFVYKGYSTESQQMAQNSPAYSNNAPSDGTYQPGTFRPSGSSFAPPIYGNNPGDSENNYGTNASGQNTGHNSSPYPTQTQPKPDALTNQGTMPGGGTVSPGPSYAAEDPIGVMPKNPSFNNPSAPGLTPGPNMATPRPGASQPTVTVAPGNSSSASTGLSENLRKFAGKDGVFIFVVGTQNSQVGQAINQLTDALSINDRAVEVQSGHTVIGLRYAGPLDNVSKNFRYGRIFYIDEDSRTIHVQGN
jgi:hypothetical protein